MRRDEALVKLKEREVERRQLGVEHLYLFGSTARDEARADSDVDLVFDDRESSLGLYELMDVKDMAARVLGCKADEAQPAPGLAGEDRGFGPASVLMAAIIVRPSAHRHYRGDQNLSATRWRAWRSPLWSLT